MLGASAVAVALFIVLVDGSDEGEPADTSTLQTTTTETTAGGGTGAAEEPKPDKPPKPEEPEVAVIEVEGGEPVGGVQELEFDKGDQIRFTVRSDVADHVHLHGYDVFQDIEAGGRATFDVPATEEGVFEVELEDRVVALAEITVNP